MKLMYGTVSGCAGDRFPVEEPVGGSVRVLLHKNKQALLRFTGAVHEALSLGLTLLQALPYRAKVGIAQPKQADGKGDELTLPKTYGSHS